MPRPLGPGPRRARPRRPSSCDRAPSGCASCGAIHAALGGIALGAALLGARPQLRRGAHDHAAARGHHRPHARDGGHRRPDPQDPAGASGGWDDEDARLLATTFNTLTDSIARFQREAAQRERLSSLGRLSTVDRPRDPQSADDHQGARCARCARDGATRGGRARGRDRHRRGDRPPQPARQRRARLRAADPLRPGAGRPQRASAAMPRGAGSAGRGRRSSRRAGRPALPTLVTDAERLRTALVNILTNAAARRSQASRGAGRRALVDPRRPGASGRVAIVGPRPRHRHRRTTDLPRIFDPYFTTRRARHRPRPCHRQEHHRRARAARSPSRAGRRRAPTIRIELRRRADAGRRLRQRQDAHGRLDPPRRRRREDPARRSARALRDDGHEVDRRRRAPASAQQLLGRAAVRPARRRQPDAGHDRASTSIRELAAVDARSRAAADRDDDGARHASRAPSRR